MKTLKEEWKIFCRYLYSNVLQMEKGVDVELEESFRQDKPFTDRLRLINKIKYCKEAKEKIVKSVNEREFYLQDGDVEVIEKLGYTYYFKYMDCYL